MNRDRFSVYAAALLMVALWIAFLLWLAVRSVGPAISTDPTPTSVILVLPESSQTPTVATNGATPTPIPDEPVVRPTATPTLIPFVTTTPDLTETPTRVPATMTQKGARHAAQT